MEMVNMYWEEHEELEQDVLVVGDSNVFHFLIDEFDNPASRVKSVCGKAESPHTYESATREDVDEMLEEGKRPCDNCLHWLDTLFDIEYYSCIICNRTSLTHNTVYRTLDVPYMTGGEDSVSLCQNCILRVKRRC